MVLDHFYFGLTVGGGHVPGHSSILYLFSDKSEKCVYRQVVEKYFWFEFSIMVVVVDKVGT